MKTHVTSTPPVSSVAIPDRVEWQGEPVLTTGQLAKSFGATSKSIQMNHNRNQGRFIEGVHFFKLTGSELKTFKDYPTDSGLVDPRAPHVYLWTKRGAARHSKILDTDTAWDVFDALERNYFEGAPPPAFEIPKTYAGALRLAADQTERAERAEAELVDARPKVEAHDDFIASDGLFTMQPPRLG